jgi:type II restriction enzyme
VVRTDWYAPLGPQGESTSTIVEKFVQTLMKSNRTYDFFVDWAKATTNVKRFRAALTQMQAARGKGSLRDTLVDLLVRDPSVAQLVPLLLAWRVSRGPVSDVTPDGTTRIEQYDFSGRSPLTKESASKLVDFLEKTGFLEHSKQIPELVSYYFGVEVGLDTNARKNRSGRIMERALTPLIHAAAPPERGWTITSQANPGDSRTGKIDVPTELESRRFDFVLAKGSRRIDIEVNFYDKQGSKPQEIVDSYINRAGELGRAGWEFVWVTDGPGWKTGKNQLRKAFDSMDAVLNIEFCRLGILSTILSTDKNSSI